MARVLAGAALVAVLALLPSALVSQTGALDLGHDRADGGDALTLRVLPADAPPAGLAPAPGALADMPRDGGGRSPHMLRDASLLFGGTAAYAMIRSKHRGSILGHGSLSNILQNFRDPVGRALAGSDRDSFVTNYVAHPVTWGGIVLYLKYQGYSDLGAFALSQAHSVFWEFMVEGAYTVPSGRDMVTNFFSAAAFVYVLPLVTGELFPSSDGEKGDGDGLTLRLAPPIDHGPHGPILQLGLEIR